MCGIAGVLNNSNSTNLVKQVLNIMKSRGLDSSNIAPNNHGSLGHNLFALVNFVPQPLTENNNHFITNCEIYNWKELNKQYSLNSKNDADLLFKLLNKFKLNALRLLDGVYAFAYLDENNLILARDLIGIKPIWFSAENGFYFASEKKALESINCKNIQELNPRKILIYNLKTKKHKFVTRDFFKITPEVPDNKELIIKNLSSLLENSIKKRIPKQKVGVLFSGGLDSSLIAFYLKKLKVPFTCYTACLDSETEPVDLTWAKKVAKQLKIKLKVKKVKFNELENYLKTIVPLIEDNNVTKVGVALTLFPAIELAKKDNVKVLFSGNGAEDIFAGYSRHVNSSSINKECYSTLLKVYERDTYRDDVISMYNNIELRLPFYDKYLVSYALKIPSKFKVQDNLGKYILRETALSLGLSKEVSFRKRLAAQYGSNFDKSLEKLAKLNKFKFKSDYLKQFYKKDNLRLGVLYSSGKDSNYAMYIMKKQNYDISCLISIKSKNKDSYMFHTPNIDLVKIQSKCLQIPLILQESKGVKETELKDLEKAIKLAIKTYKIEGLVTGALFSDYQRSRIEKICDKLGLKLFSPLWHKPQELEMKELLDNNFKFIFTKVAALGLDSTWLNKVITIKELNELIKLNKKYGLNVAGEGGEFESLVLNCPLFKKEIKIVSGNVKMENESTGIFLITKIKLISAFYKSFD